MFLRPRLFHRLSTAVPATCSFRAASKRSIHSESTNVGTTYPQKLALDRHSAIGDTIAHPDASLLHQLADKELVKAFFKAARKSNATDAAEVICTEFQSASALDRYLDCFLRNGVLPWLLSHLVFNAKNRQLGKDIMQELVRTKEDITPHERGDIIALCAAGGYASETRALWERYSISRDTDMVSGHTKCLVGIVKLFERIAAKNRRGLAHKDDMKGAKETRLGDITSGVTQGQLTKRDVGIDRIKFMNEPSREAVVNEKSRSDFDCAGELSSGVKTTESFISSMDASDGRQVGTVTSAHPSAEADLSRADKMEDGAVSDVDADEYYAFARKVVDTYQRAKEPLTQASHYDLNALAHCSEVLGMVRIGMRALQIIVDRKEVPDTRDLNVVIRAMATRDALRAEEMLMRMLHEGLHLNAHSFASVILGWLQRGQIARASRIYTRAIRAGHAKLPSEPARALICACLDASRTADASQSQADEGMQRTLLRHVYSLISSGACSRSSMPRERCVQCVSTATRLEEAGLAFYFWKQLLKTNRRKESAEETELRQAVAVLIGKAMGSGTISTKEGKQMVTELGGIRGD